MTFKELFSQFNFAEISPAFLNLWQTNEPKLAEQLDLDKWERIYQNVQALEAKSTQYYIRLVWRWETCSPMIDMNCSVYDKADNVVGNSWHGIGGGERLCDYATRACCRLAVGNHVFRWNGRNCTE